MLTILATIKNISFYIRYCIFLILKKTLGEYYFGYYFEDWQYLIDEKQEYEELYNETHPSIKYIPKSSKFNNICIFICINLIQLRLFIIAERWVYPIIKFILFYLLIFNKLLLPTYIILIIIISSRFLLLFQYDKL